MLIGSVHSIRGRSPQVVALRNVNCGRPEAYRLYGREIECTNTEATDESARYAATLITKLSNGGRDDGS